MSEYSEIKTQFVGELLKETRWKDRQYIGHLMGLERILARGGPKGWGDGMAYGSLSREYPLETEILRQEMRDGQRTSVKEFKGRQVERKKREQAEAREYRGRLRCSDEAQRQQWLEAGGLP